MTLDKELATLQVLAALAGVRLDRIEVDSGGYEFVVTRWALTRSFRTLDEARAFLATMGIGKVEDRQHG